MPNLKFDVHPAVAMIQKWTAELPAKTGRDLEQWAEVVKKSKLTERKDRIALLKSEYGLGTNSAMHIVDYAADRSTWDGDPAIYLKQAVKYVEEQYSGNKAALRPMFETLYAEVRTLGKDVKVCPCKTIVPFYRNRVFAEVKPATKTRLELSFALADAPFEGSLVRNPRANEKDRLKHQVHLASAADITPEVLSWLRLAYDEDAATE
jgi:predicted transport protein